MASGRRVVIFSGGSAANNLVDVFDDVTKISGCSLSGPGIGDVRSRLVRLIPSSHFHIRNLFNHRLSGTSEMASAEFSTLLSGTSSLYNSIPTAQAMLIRSILAHLHLEILKRNRVSAFVQPPKSKKVVT